MGIAFASIMLDWTNSMIENERIVGASCLLINDSGLIWEIQKPHKWQRKTKNQIVIVLGCIGNMLEEGETPVTALQREAKEEIGCSLHLWSANSIIEVFPNGDVLDETGLQVI